MAPFRPANLNKRAYPGNASVIGLTCTATLGITTTTCCACISTLCGSQCLTYTLGCRSLPSSCSCCPCCCCCLCTVCDRTVPSGRWKASEQYEAKTRDAWGDDTCSAGSAVGFCGSSGTITGGNVDNGGFFVCTNGVCRWFISAAITEKTCSYDNGYTPTVECACTNGGDCSWYIGNVTEMRCAGFTCRTYWDSYTSSLYWTSTQKSNYPRRGVHVDIGTGQYSQSSGLYCHKTSDNLRLRAMFNKPV
jgi:hypothetical protein